MMDLKTLIAKTAIDPRLTRVRTSMRRKDRETIPDGYRNAFDKLSIRWGLIFVVDQIVIPETKTPGHPSFRSLRYNKNDVRSTHILMARNETRHREQSKRLHSLLCIR